MEKVLIGLLGVILGAILAVAKEVWVDHRSKKKKAQYLAVRVAFLLDKFVSNSIEVVGDDGEMYGRDEQGCIRLNTTLPEIDFLSLEVDWQALPFELMYEILNFPALVDEANGMISSVFEFVAHPPDYDEGVEERQIQYAELGLKAIDLENKIRSKYGMPKRAYNEWSPIEHLSVKRGQILKLRKKREEHYQKLSQRA